MDIEDYINPSGEIVDSNPPCNYAFMPNPLPPEIEIPDVIKKKALDVELLLSTMGVHQADGLKGVSLLRENVRNLFIIKEALHSTNIEGTTATFDDVLLLNKDNPQYFEKGLNEVYSNQEAMLFLIDHASKNIDLTMNHLSMCHKILMKDIMHGSLRNIAKSVGLVREIQNYIKNNKGEIIYVPPPVGIRLDNLIENFNRYINHSHEEGKKLFAIANAHYQFETIHPFEDGNGRIGRALIQALLVKYGLSNHPNIDLSYFFLTNKADYVKCLEEVRKKSDWLQWYVFFLEAVEKQINESLEFQNRLNNMVIKIQSDIRSSGGRLTTDLNRIILYTLRKPLFTIEGSSKDLGINYNTVKNNVSRLVSIGFCNEIKKNNQQYFICGELIKLFIS